MTEGENIDNGVVTYFNIKNYNDKDEVTLTYLNNSRDTIVSFGNNFSGKQKLKLI